MTTHKLQYWWKWEPTRLIGHGITTLILLLNVLVAFGVILEDQASSLNAMLTGIAVIVSGGTEAIRSKVYSPGRVEALEHIETLPPKKKAKALKASKNG